MAQPQILKILPFLYIFLSWKFIVCLYRVVKIFEFWRTHLKETRSAYPIAATPVFALFYVVSIPTYFENLSHLQLEWFKSSKFLNACLRRILHHFTLDFSRSSVLCDIYSTIDRSLISLSFRFKSKTKKRNNKNERNREERKKKSGLNEHKQKKGGLECVQKTQIVFHQYRYLWQKADANLDKYRSNQIKIWFDLIGTYRD